MNAELSGYFKIMMYENTNCEDFLIILTLVDDLWD
jgi:hypothetical protein